MDTRGAVMVMLLALGCVEPVESIRGTVRHGPGPAAAPAADATVSIFDLDLVLHDQVQTQDDGSFVAKGPRGETVYAEISGADQVPSGFVGAVGQGTFDVPDGELFAWSETEMAALRERHAGCSQMGGGVVHGEVRLFGATGENGSPLIRSSFARLLTEDEPIEACYLTDDGSAWNEGAEVAGDTATYTFFGIQSGLHRLAYGYIIGGIVVNHEITVYVPEEGISPQFPAWVDLVGQ